MFQLFNFTKKISFQESSVYPVIRLILAQEENERSYGIQEKSLRLLYIKALKLPKGSRDAINISQCCEKDLPQTIRDIMKIRSSTESSISVYDIDNMLSNISENQKQSFQESEIQKVIVRSNPLDHKWLIKMMLKRTNLTLGTVKVLHLYHPKARELFLKHNQLSRVCELIESNKTDIEDSVEVFKPIRSMLCQKFDRKSSRNLLQNEMYHETKMDGERFQLHMKDGEYHYYSRNSHDFSNTFNALLSPLIHFSCVVHNIILDGEMLVWDKDEKRYHAKGEATVDVKHMKDRNSHLRPCFCAFDVLYLNGQNYMNRPYNERYQLLEQLFDDREGVMVKTKPIKIRDVDHMVTLFNNAIEEEQEGIVIKDAASFYKPGERLNSGWYKVKADYFDGSVVKEFDCVIIGGYYANPHKMNYIRKYMVGAVEKQNDGTFNVYAVGEVVHGMAVVERMKVFSSIKPYLMKHSGESEIGFGMGKIYFGRNKPDAFIAPDKSIVLELRASELVMSSEQYSEYTFRFPRINDIRRDKLWHESCTLKEFQEMCQGDNGRRVKKVVMRNVNKEDIETSSHASRKRKMQSSRADIVAQFCHNTPEESRDVIDNSLDGKEFCLLTTSSSLPSVKEMKHLIRQHGGTIAELPRKGKTFAIVAGQMTKLVQSYIAQKIFNVIKAEWLEKSFLNPDASFKDMPKMRPSDFYFASDEMKTVFKDNYDEYGDSYTDEIEEHELMELVKNIDDSGNPSNEDLVEFESELYDDKLKNQNFFRGICGLFTAFEQSHFIMQSAKSVFQYHAGTIAELSDATATERLYIFIDRNQPYMVENFIQNESISKSTFIDYRWILDSNDFGGVLSTDSYQVLNF